MSEIKCSVCGNVIETIPQCCAHDMIFNEETKQMECFFGPDCGYIPLSELFCSKCAEKCEQ